MPEEVITPQPFELDGRKGQIVYLDKEKKPIPGPENAAIARVMWDDGGSSWFYASDNTAESST